MENNPSGTSRTARLSASELRRINLNGNDVPYVLMRCRRKTIGMRISSSGLTVRIPMRESLGWVDAVLQKRADWIVKKLEEWKDRKPGGPVWEEGAIFPLLGEPWQLVAAVKGSAHMVRLSEKPRAECKQTGLGLSSLLTPRQIEDIVMNWYRNQALACFSERIAYYAPKLGVSVRELKLSSARTLWGSCTAKGVVRLNWRLIQKPLHLIDYVVAHELSHLIEMNHSPAFWRIVEHIYPDYVTARRELKRYGQSYGQLQG
jgi:predicted metal-dependent hydrolase